MEIWALCTHTNIKPHYWPQEHARKVHLKIIMHSFLQVTPCGPCCECGCAAAISFYVRNVFWKFGKRNTLILLLRKISGSAAGPWEQQCNASIQIFIICNPVSALPYIRIKLFKANFSSVPREHLSISWKGGFYLTRLHAHAGAVRCLTGIAELRQLRMKVHWWSLAGNLLLVFLALAENISFLLVSSENKFFPKKKEKK